MGTGPSPRAGHTAVVLHKTNVLIFGGGYIDKVYNDVHMLNVGTNNFLIHGYQCCTV